MVMTVSVNHMYVFAKFACGNFSSRSAPVLWFRLTIIRIHHIFFVHKNLRVLYEYPQYSRIHGDALVDFIKAGLPPQRLEKLSILLGKLEEVPTPLIVRRD